MPNDKKLKYVTDHEPVSCAVHTNVPGFDYTCFVEPDPDVLVQKLIDHLENIAVSQYESLTC